jgi:hypothetical protein
MRVVFDVIAVGTLAVAAREILRVNRLRHEKRHRREALQTWEHEGGAVPVSRSATAAQVSPAPDAVLPS